MSEGVRCYNESCGDDGTCALQYIGMCPVAKEEEAYWRRQYAFDASFKPMTQEQQIAHFAWKRGVGRDPWSEE